MLWRLTNPFVVFPAIIILLVGIFILVGLPPGPFIPAHAGGGVSYDVRDQTASTGKLDTLVNTDGFKHDASGSTVSVMKPGESRTISWVKLAFKSFPTLSGADSEYQRLVETATCD